MGLNHLQMLAAAVVKLVRHPWDAPTDVLVLFNGQDMEHVNDQANNHLSSIYLMILNDKLK